MGAYGSNLTYAGREQFLNEMVAFCSKEFVDVDIGGYASQASPLRGAATYGTGFDGDLAGFNNSSELIFNGYIYWLGTAYTTDDSKGIYAVRRVYGPGKYLDHDQGQKMGIRVLVTLKPGVRTGEGANESFLGRDSCWSVK